MRTRLRRLLDLIVEPPRVYSGRHTLGVPADGPAFNFWANTWVDETWADIAARHGIETHP